MATAHRQQLSVRVRSHPHRLLARRAGRVRITAPASRLPGLAAAAARDTFVANLLQDMTELLPEFEETFETGCR